MPAIICPNSTPSRLSGWSSALLEDRRVKLDRAGRADRKGEFGVHVHFDDATA
jgi:hypothetical protein